MKGFYGYQLMKAGDILVALEAMKMETALQAERDGTIERVVAPAGTRVDVKDFPVVFGDEKSEAEQEDVARSVLN